MTSPAERAAAWLAATYGGLVRPVGPSPVHESPTARLMTCQAVAQPGYPHAPVLAASVVVPNVRVGARGLAIGAGRGVGPAGGWPRPDPGAPHGRPRP